MGRASVHSEYIAKVFIIASVKGVVDGDRLNLLRVLWSELSYLKDFFENLACNNDFLRIIEDDEYFSYILKSSHSMKFASVLYTEITGDSTGLLSYSDLKSFLQFNSYFNKIENFDLMLSTELNSLIALRFTSSGGWYYEINSIANNKTFEKIPVFRIVKDLRFNHEPVSHRYFIRDWSYFVSYRIQNCVAEWFESHSHVSPSIFAIWYITQFFIEGKDVELGVSVLDETPFEWLEVMED